MMFFLQQMIHFWNSVTANIHLATQLDRSDFPSEIWLIRFAKIQSKTFPVGLGIPKRVSFHFICYIYNKPGSFKTPEEDKEEIQEATASLAAALSG